MQPGTLRRHLALQLFACLGDPHRRILGMVILMTGPACCGSPGHRAPTSGNDVPYPAKLEAVAQNTCPVIQLKYKRHQSGVGFGQRRCQTCIDLCKSIQLYPGEAKMPDTSSPASATVKNSRGRPQAHNGQERGTDPEIKWYSRSPTPKKRTTRKAGTASVISPEEEHITSLRWPPISLPNGDRLRTARRTMTGCRLSRKSTR